MTRALAILTPIADWIAITCFALVPVLGMHIVGLDANIAKREAQTQLYEKFVINCLSGRILLVDRPDAVECVKL